MTIYKFLIHSSRPDPRNARHLADAHALGFHNLKQISIQNIYFIEGQLSQEACQKLSLTLLTDPVTQLAAWEEIPSSPTHPEPDSVILEVALRPGVTDPVAEQIVRASHELGIHGVHRAATGQRYILQFHTPDSSSDSSSDFIRLSVTTSAAISAALLANPIIQCWTNGNIEPSFPEEVESNGAVEIISLRALSEEGLLSLSKTRRAALDLAEMQTIQNYFTKENRDPTDIEFETTAQTWSEHCVHKAFKAKVTINDGQATVDSLIKTYLKSATDKIAAPRVISAFVDNAGIIDFDNEFEISFKAETHNHPSAVEPFGGANTGVGGVIRDVIGVSAKPIANTDVLCFGPQNLNPFTPFHSAHFINLCHWHD